MAVRNKTVLEIEENEVLKVSENKENSQTQWKIILNKIK